MKLKTKNASSPVNDPEPTDAKTMESPSLLSSDARNVNNRSPAKIQTDQRFDTSTAKIQTSDQRYETLSGNKPHPAYLTKGPIISEEMYNKWTPQMLGLPESRPVRSTRNPSPKYVDSISLDASHVPRFWSASKSELESLNKAISS